MEADLKKGTIFDASGALQAFLDAFVEIDVGFFSHRWDFEIASVTLAQIGQSPSPIAQSHIPQLATLDSGGVLQLNIGAYAPQRLYASASNTAKPGDGNENLTVTQVYNSDGSPKIGSVYVSGSDFGVQNQEYDGVTEIVGDGLAGNDTIRINVDSSIDVSLAAGGGTNSFVVQNAGKVTLVGGAGTDTLEVDRATAATITAGSGTETLVAGNVPGATLQAGSGQDALYGGSGAGQSLLGSSGTVLLVAGPGANQVLHGGTGVSTIVGGSGAGQQLFGDTSTANIFGGTGANQTLTAGTGNDHLYGGEADQVLYGGSGTDVLQVGWSLPNASASASFSNLPVGAIDNSNSTGQPLQVGWHLQEQTHRQWVANDKLHARARRLQSGSGARL